MVTEIDVDLQALTENMARAIVDIIVPILSQKAMHSSPQPLLDVATLAAYLAVSKQWVYDKVHNKQIPHFKVGKYPRFHMHEVLAWLEDQHHGPKNVHRAWTN